MNKEKEFKVIPILEGFNYDKCIGSLRILKDRLPVDPNFHFALGYKTEPFEILCISPVPDHLFTKAS